MNAPIVAAASSIRMRIDISGVTFLGPLVPAIFYQSPRILAKTVSGGYTWTSFSGFNACAGPSNQPIRCADWIAGIS